jgi:hypothetical protein
MMARRMFRLAHGIDTRSIGGPIRVGKGGPQIVARSVKARNLQCPFSSIFNEPNSTPHRERATGGRRSQPAGHRSRPQRSRHPHPARRRGVA